MVSEVKDNFSMVFLRLKFDEVWGKQRCLNKFSSHFKNKPYNNISISNNNYLSSDLCFEFPDAAKMPFSKKCIKLSDEFDCDG